jgi:putative copper resistance protein D
VLLGVAGWRHRSSLLKRADAGAPRVLGRLAVGELVIMSVALGLGVALSVSAPPVSDSAPTLVTAAESITGYPLPGPTTTLTWLTTWRLDLLWVTVVAVLAGAYLVGVWRLTARGDRWPVLRTLPWLAGCLLLLWVTNGATGVYGRVLFSSHMLSHMTLSMVVPPLLVLGAPVTLALRTMTARRDGSRGPREWLLAIVHSRLLGVLGMPIVAAALFAVSLVVFYYSPLFELSLRTHTGHVLMHVHFLLTGYLFASVLIGIDPGPARPPYPLRLVVLFATMGFHAFFGMSLLQGTDLLAPGVLDSLGRTWGRTPLEDQRYGAGIAWGLGEFPTLMLGMAVALAWVRSDERDSRRTDRAADRDGDAELADYNARLADLARGRAAPR